MEPILSEFISDLERIKKLVFLLDAIKQHSSFDIKNFESVELNTFYTMSIDLHSKAKDSNTGIVILPGTLLLYLGGRFENYVRTVFEELCMMIAANCESYDDLPKAMKENLLKFSAEVIANPRRYGHGKNGVESFIQNLHQSIINKSLEALNVQCLSITYENMRPDTLSELFERIGAKNIWESIAQQAKMKLFLRISDSSQAKTEARKILNDFVELRNKIAHPSGEFSWPDHSKVLFYIDFLEQLAVSIKEVAPIFSIQLTEKIKESV